MIIGESGITHMGDTMLPGVAPASKSAGGKLTGLGYSNARLRPAPPRPAASLTPLPRAMLINCAAYQNGRKLADIAKEDISEYLLRPDCFVWVALFDPETEELEEMAEEFGLHPLAVDDARHGHQRPKIEEYGDSLFAVLHTLEPVKTPDGSEELGLGEVDVFVGVNYILSVRHRTQVGFSAVRARTEREPELLRHGSGYVFYALMDNVVDRYFPDHRCARSRSSRRSRNRSSCVAKRARNIESLYALKQKVMRLKHAVDPLMEATGRLYGGRVPQICAGMGEYFRDVYDHLHRIHSSIEGIREMLTTAIQVNLGMISLSDNEVTKTLAAWAAIIAVPTMIAGIYGMNFEFMPELKSPFGYPLALLAMAAIDVYLFFHFKKVKWL